MSAQFERIKMGPLEAIRFVTAAPRANPDLDSSPPGKAIVFFHGFGANAMDLAPLATELYSRPGTAWYFPEGILEFPMGPGAVGRAWWEIDQQALEIALQSGSHRDLRTYSPPPAAPDAARAAIDSLGLPRSSITLGGFSQGAMLATMLTMEQEESPEGLVILSGAFLDAENWSARAPRHAGLQFFQSHGTDDPLLSYNQARELEKLLRNSGLTGEFISFSGGHEIPTRVVKHLSEYLRR